MFVVRRTQKAHLCKIIGLGGVLLRCFLESSNIHINDEARMNTLGEAGCINSGPRYVSILRMVFPLSLQTQRGRHHLWARFICSHVVTVPTLVLHILCSVNDFRHPCVLPFGRWDMYFCPNTVD